MRVYESLAPQCGQGRGNLLAAVQSPVRVLFAVLQTLGHQLQSVSVNTRIVTLPSGPKPGKPRKRVHRGHPSVPEIRGRRQAYCRGMNAMRRFLKEGAHSADKGN